MPIDPDAVIWSAPERERAGRPLLVLLHGYGSNEGDLFQLAPYLPLDYVIASVRAPMSMGYGWAWFRLDDPSLNRLDPGPIGEVADAVRAWLDDVSAEASRVDLLGFSQGGMVAAQMLRRVPDDATRLVLLASMVASSDEPGDDELARLRPAVFWGRGTHDNVIPDAGIEHTAAWLPEHATLSTRIYEGLGHGISDAMLADVNAFLRDELDDQDERDPDDA
jgi:phospholipase/carboxylesterase